ncbi:M20/M25/M40 family metallo-hydrolase [Conexibacter sp. JD483]|uniref:M20/M25/M40 family metallo-hydrolase n=1 Tax=unclassified Conexibacter TaxID=2627773 RepID=UPI00271D30DE|nr:MULTISPECIES: M20/M25/M40 family metallo-hydrolase [unclassified Conexibacter]MDO8185565.1 M20/M25/M40 family metallo-hydrolase [Conexibacter sp. CPCC 205706]MDO8197248.1 M20/M25/M40 family metallo-hydrolase [Conexibacter sp. CPCC 205762]MDR9371529.1 M20/M25/M40 family metallo-hydrolase [Conexibacter sp. JD483]
MTATDPTATDLAARVRAAVDAAFDDAVELLEELVAIDSTNPSFPGIDGTAAAGGEARCVALLEQRYLALGLRTERVASDPVRPNLVATLAGAGDGRALILNGHVDTVPPVRRETWTMADPWRPERRGGELLGLGATDMKGGLAAGWLAVRALRDAGVALAGDLCVQCVVGEEQMQHELGTSAATAAALAALGVDSPPDAERIGAIVLEPSSTPEPLSLSPLSAGNHVFRVTIDGRATHAGNRGEAVRPGGAGSDVGVNAVEKALLIVRALQELEQEWGQTRSHPAFAPGFFTINPGALHADAGTPSPAYLADRAELDVLAWYPPDEAAEDVRAELEWRIATAAALDPWLRDTPPRIDWLGNWPAASTTWEAPVVQALAQAREQVTGAPTPAPGPDHRSGFAAVTDASFLEAAGIPAVVFGPGDLRRAHSADEGIELEQLKTCAAAVALAAIDFCGVAP